MSAQGFNQGECVKVKPAYDIPLLFRPSGGPSVGVIDHIADDGLCIVVVEGKSVPYQPDELERC